MHLGQASRLEIDLVQEGEAQDDEDAVVVVDMVDD